MAKYKIVGIELSTGEKSPTKLTTSDGSVINGFFSSLKEVRAGAEVECEVIPKGKYLNIDEKTFKILSQGSESVPSNGNVKSSNGKGDRYSLEGIHLEKEYNIEITKIRNNSIEAQVGLKEVGDTLRSIMEGKAETFKPFSDQEIINLKNLWIEGVTRMLSQTFSMKQTLQKAPHVQKPEPEEIDWGENDRMKDQKWENVGQMLQYCSAKGIKRADIMRVLQVNENQLAKVNLQEAWDLIYNDLIKTKVTTPE